MKDKVTVSTLAEKKRNEEKISMLTAYDYNTACLLDEAGIDMLLVGDSLGMVILGYEDTISVTMEDMLHHTRAVARGADRALVVGDMPFMSYQADRKEALKNAGRLMKEGRANAVKLEGGTAVVETVSSIVDAGIPVMGHLGLTPQAVNTLGGFKVQGKTQREVESLLEDASRLEEAGIFALVLECVPQEAASLVTKRLSIPTIGIGAGSVTDGQVLVTQDMIGLIKKFKPSFVRQYASLSEEIQDACRKYIDDIQQHKFPSEDESFSLSPDSDWINDLKN